MEITFLKDSPEYFTSYPTDCRYWSADWEHFSSSWQKLPNAKFDLYQRRVLYLVHNAFKLIRIIGSPCVCSNSSSNCFPLIVKYPFLRANPVLCHHAYWNQIFPFLSAPYCVFIWSGVSKYILFCFPVQPFQNEQCQNTTDQQNRNTDKNLSHACIVIAGDIENGCHGIYHL